MKASFEKVRIRARHCGFSRAERLKRKTRRNAAPKTLNQYKTAVIYDPVDLKLMLHEYKEWGIEIKAKLIGFNEYLLSLIENGTIKVKKSDREYSLQDNYAYARDLDDSETGRKLIGKSGR